MLRISLYELKRYQALKTPKEKLKVSKEEMTRVQSLARVEALVFQAILEKELMCIWLEKTTKQKNRENGEWPKSHDSLVSKVEIT